MQRELTCIPCALAFGLRTMDQTGVSQDLRKQLFFELAELGLDPNMAQTPARVGTAIARLVAARSGVADPWAAIKYEQNATVLAHYQTLADQIAAASDPLHLALRVAALGNTIDVGANPDHDVSRELMAVANVTLAHDDSQGLRDELTTARTLLLVADNCGEVVCDWLLLETIHAAYPDLALYISVKSGPILNDVTVAEIDQVGINCATVIPTGADALGVERAESDPAFLELLDTADIVISKGHANFETLVGSARHIYFLLKAKCEPVAAIAETQVGQVLLRRLPHA